MNACRTALGALQWLAIQSQPLLCSRCNLLLTEVVTGGTLETAREIQHMVGEVRQCPTQLRFFPLEGVSKWTDVVFISMGDQAHSNRPQGDSKAFWKLRIRTSGFGFFGESYMVQVSIELLFGKISSARPRIKSSWSRVSCARTLGVATTLLSAMSHRCLGCQTFDQPCRLFSCVTIFEEFIVNFDGWLPTMTSRTP